MVSGIMEKEVGRVHRLVLPLIVKRNGTSLIISDGVFGHEYDFKEFGQLKVTSVDPQGFVTFEIALPQQQTLYETTIPIIGKIRSTETGFVLIGSGTAKSSSGASTHRGTYEYFKRPTDEYYYTIHKLGSKTKKIHLGSLQEPSSHIRQIVHTIQSFSEDALIDRKKLTEKLSIPVLRHGQKLKSVLDILVIEGYLEKREVQRRGRIHEEYKQTPKIMNIR